MVALVLFGSGTRAQANLIIDPTFDSSIATQTDAAAIEGAINAAISAVEADITNNVTATIDFKAVTTGLGESNTYIYTLSYYNYYNALKTIDTAPGASLAQQDAFASLGAAPTGPSSGNPVNSSTQVDLTGPNARILGFSASPPPGDYDTVISVNTSLTSPPNSLSGYYGLQSVAAHEIDEALGIGGTGSTLGDSTTAVGALDLYRYTCSVTITATLTCPAGDASRSWSTVQTTNPYSYFSINGGATILSFFNQTSGADYADWLSNPIPPLGFGPQVQDAYGEPGTDPSLGVNELMALNAIGYNLSSSALVPEPPTLPLTCLGLGLGVIFFKRPSLRMKSPWVRRWRGRVFRDA